MSHLKTISKAFAAAAFATFTMIAPVSAQEVDLVERFGDLVDVGDSMQQLVDSLKDSGFKPVGLGSIVDQEGRLRGHLSLFANDAQEWRLVSLDARFMSAQVMAQGTDFSVINYRYNVKISYDDNSLLDAQSRPGGQNNNCMTEEAFGRQVLKERFPTGFLMQGYDEDYDIMKIYVDNDGKFMLTEVSQDRLRTTCGITQGEGLSIAPDFLPQ